jgi:glutamyl/glutaminyl-tRNA synthetase
MNREKRKIWSYAKVKESIFMPYAEELIKNGWAYYAFDSSEALEQQEKNKKKRKYL